MERTIFLAFNKDEFKNFLKEAVREVLAEEQKGSDANNEQILGVAEAAKFLKLQINTLYEKTSHRGVPHFKKGNRLYFYRSELEAWLKEGKVKTDQEIQSEAVTVTMGRKKAA
jgi:excisionase family DNA binding protein